MPATSGSSPSKTASTCPDGRSRTHPATPRVRACRLTAARKPTPCTRPETTTRRRTAMPGKLPKPPGKDWEAERRTGRVRTQKATPMRLRIAALAATTLALAGAAPAAARTHYVVRYGDTLTGIARAHGVGLRRLAHANHRRVYGVLRAGTVLVIPGGRSSPPGGRYTVRWGDTLTGIAARFGVSVDRLARLNRISPHG